MSKQSDMLGDPTDAIGLAEAVCSAMDAYIPALQESERLITKSKEQWPGTADIFVYDLEDAVQRGSFLKEGRDPFNLAACAKDFYDLLPEAEKFKLRPMFTEIVNAVKEQKQKAAGTDKAAYIDAWAGIILDRLASFSSAREKK